MDHAQSEGGGGSAPSLSLIRLRYVPNVCLLLNSSETFRVVEPFFSLEKLVAPVQPQIAFSRTIEKLDRMCDLIGHTPEPCKGTLVS